MNDTVFLSKSKYVEFRQCPKAGWLRRHKPEVLAESDDALAQMQTGSEVGSLAKGLFGTFVDVSMRSENGLDLSAMMDATRREMEKQTPVICEAAFSFGGLYCAVDILRQEDGGWAIYEVKSSTDAEKPEYLADVAYQTYVLRRCGVDVTRACLVCLNNQYIYNGELDLQQLFRITDLTDAAMRESNAVGEQIAAARLLLASDEEPNNDLSERCGGPGACAFWAYCTRCVKSPSVFDLYRLPFKEKLKKIPGAPWQSGCAKIFRLALA